MNKTMMKWFSMLLLLMVGTIGASAQTIALEDFSIKAGETKDVAITVSEAVYGIQTDVTLSEGLTLVSAASAQEGLSFNKNDANGRMALLSLSGAHITAGDAITLQVKAADDFTGGTIALKNTYLTTDNLGTEIKPADVTATVTLEQVEVPETYAIVGELTGGWNDASETPDVAVMTKQANGLYTYVVESFAAEAKGYQYKLRANSKWGLFELPSNGNQTYTFTEAGNYKLTFTANVTDEEIAGVAAYTLTLDAEKIEEPVAHTYTIAGETAIVNGSVEWDAAAEANLMTQDSEDANKYTLTVEGAKLTAGSYEYKVVVDKDWNAVTIPAGGNAKLTIDAIGVYTIEYTLTLGNGADGELGTVSAVATKTADVVLTNKYLIAGSANLMGAAWDASGTKNVMTDNGDGTFGLVLAEQQLAASTDDNKYEYKLVTLTYDGDELVNTTWGAGNNKEVEISEAGKYVVTFTYDPATGVVSHEAERTDAPQPVTLTGISIKGSTDATWAAEKQFEWELTVADDGETYAVADKDVTAGMEFKVVAKYSDDTEKWLSPESNGNFLVTEALLGQELALAADKKNMTFDKAGTFTFTVKADLSTLTIAGAFAEEPQPTGLTAVTEKFWKWESEAYPSEVTETTIIENMEIVATSSKKIQFDANNKTFEDIAFTKRLKFGGTGSATERHIHFKVAANSKVTVYGMSSNKDERTCNITAGTDFDAAKDHVVASITTSDNMAKAEYTATEETDLFVYSTNSGFNLYGIKVEPVGEGPVEESYTVTFVNNPEWEEVYAYAWSGEGDNLVQTLGAWPGTKMTVESAAKGDVMKEPAATADVYTITFNAGTMPEYIIFNNGKSGDELQQTEDLAFVDEKEYTYEEPVEEEATWTVAGSPTVFGTNWDTANTANDMVKQDDGTYKWEKTELTLPAGNVEFKVVKNHVWGESYPANNYVLPIAESGIYTITITFDPESKEVNAVATKTGSAEVETTYVVAGDLAELFGTTWDGMAEANKMEKQADGTYKKAYTSIAIPSDPSDLTSFEYKIVKNGSEWFGAADGGNLIVSVDAGGTYDITFTFDPDTNVPNCEAVRTDAPVESDTWTIAGAGELVGSLWEPTDVANDMTSEDGVTWTLTKTDVSLAKGDYSYKVVKNHAWDESYGAETTESNPTGNAVLAITEPGTYTIVFTFNSDTKALSAVATKTADYVITSYNVVGSSVELFGGNDAWDPTLNPMTKGEGEVYTWTKEKVQLTAGDIEYKVAANGEWVVSYPEAENNHLSIEQDGWYNVTITLDLTGVEPVVTAKADKWAAAPDGTYYVVGDETLIATGWDKSVAGEMTQNADGTYTVTLTDVTMTAGEGLEYKITDADGNWYPDGEGNNLTIDGPATDGVYTITIVFDPFTGETTVTVERTGDIPTGIMLLQAAIENGDAVVYNLRGQRVSTVQRGIYIVNGKKQVVK